MALKRDARVLRALPERTFSALQLICIMYAGFKRIEQGMDIGVDLAEEWMVAEMLADDTLNVN
jgi:hypothetical protein